MSPSASRALPEAWRAINARPSWEAFRPSAAATRSRWRTSTSDPMGWKSNRWVRLRIVGKLVGLSRGKHEMRMLRRFFERLEQSVGGGPRKHVGLVQDVDPARLPRHSPRFRRSP